MNRIEALQKIIDATPSVPVVATCAATSRELAAVEDRPNHLYLLDAMGLTSSVGVGFALAFDASSLGRVVVVDGDGSLFMNLGSLATIGYLTPERLVLLVLDNAVYASTAAIPTYAERVDLGAIAAAAGISLLRASTPTELERTLERTLAEPGPHMLHVRITPENAPGTPPLLMDPVVLAARFRSWLQEMEDQS